MTSSRTDYYNYLQTYLPDNSAQLISPQDVRTVLIDLVESIPNFLTDKELSTANLGSEDIRCTRAGDLALQYINDNGRYNEDNSAFGYYTMAANYSGVRNTAVGSYGLGCNLYGNDNVAVGFSSAAGNLTGSGNVSVGNYALRNNKYGDFNIAIGHGAGANINPNSNYKFFLGSYPVDSGSLCLSCPQESGFTHLMYGELDSLKLGVAVKTLHNMGTLQVSGAVSPHLNKDSDIGHPYRMWRSLYLSSGIGYDANTNFIVSSTYEQFPGQVAANRMATFTDSKISFGNTLPSGQGFMTIGGSVVPSQDKIYSLGHENLKWNGVFGNILVSGTAQFNVVTWQEKQECIYKCKTLHLATSGICEDDIFQSSFCGLLTDEGVDGAGFEVHSSGVNYKRDYRFIYKFPDQTLECLESDNAFSRSRWHSNISLEIASGCHLTTQRIHSRDSLSMVTQSNCYGLFIYDAPQILGSNLTRATFGKKTDTDFARGLFNVVYNSGCYASFASRSSGVPVNIELVSRIENTPQGFDIVYSDNKNATDNLTIRTVGSGNNKITLNRLEPGTFGVTNASGDLYPATIFNVQSSGVCDARLTSYNLNTVSLQMLAQSNVPVSGFEILYTPKHPAKTAESIDTPSDNTVIIDFNLFSPSGNSSVREGAISIAENNFVGIGTTRFGNTRRFSPNAPLTVQHDGSISGTIALRAQSVSPAPTTNFGKFYVKPFAYSTQTHTAYFMDAGGNEYQLSPTIHERYLYVDTQANTYGGTTPNTRPLGASVNFNSAYGHKALASITAGSGNISIAGAEDLTSGNSNVFIGRDVAKGVTSANTNVVVGANQFNSTGGGNSNTLIGVNNANGSSSALNNMILIGSGLNTNLADYVVQMGYGNAPVLTGSLGGANGRKIEVRDGSFSVWSYLNDQELRVTHDKRGSRYVSNILVKDTINESVNNGMLSIRFADRNNYTRTLADFDYNANPLNVSANFNIPSPTRPFIGVSGDIRVLGAVRFADGTFLETATLNSQLNFCDLPDALSINSNFNTSNAYLALSVPSGIDCAVGKITLQSLSDFVGSGFAAVSNNCNHIWSNAEASVNKTNNASTVFIGCDVAVGATGWRNSVFIGTNAGKGATTPNTNLLTDTSCIFIGNQAGFEADNTANTVAIGTNAGYNAYNSARSVYVGSNAGQDLHGNDNIGIGFHALRGSGHLSNGSRNIEVVVGLLDNQRLMYGFSNLNDRLNIQNTIAGNTDAKKISVGHATLNPDAPLSVRRNSVVIPEHGDNSYIQTWWCNGVKVAHVDCNGVFVGGGGGGAAVSGVIEGVATQNIGAPGSPTSPTSGIMAIKNENWNTTATVYVVNKDPTLTISSGAYMQATYINGTWRPQWVGCG